jgi:hypothetical protein
MEQHREVIKAESGFRVIGTQRLLPDRQGAKVEGLGLGVKTLAFKKPRKDVEAVCCIGVIGPQRLLPDRQGAADERLGLGVGALFIVKLR